MAVVMNPFRFGSKRSTATVGVYLGPEANPTGKPIRLRKVVEADNIHEALAIETQIIGALTKYGVWPPPPTQPEEVSKAQDGPSLVEALALAWSCPREGWKQRASGRRDYTAADACLRVLHGTTPCAEVSRAHIERLRAAFEKEGFSAGYVEQMLGAFSRLLAFAEREGWISERPHWRRRAVYRPSPEQRRAAALRKAEHIQAKIDAEKGERAVWRL